LDASAIAEGAQRVCERGGLAAIQLLLDRRVLQDPDKLDEVLGHVGRVRFL